MIHCCMLNFWLWKVDDSCLINDIDIVFNEIDQFKF